MTPPLRRDPVLEAMTEPMFDIAPVKPAEPIKPAKSIAKGKCPSHDGETLTGIVRAGEHLYWRQHNGRTWDDKPRQCNASNQALHQFPAKQVKDQRETPVCDCAFNTKAADDAPPADPDAGGSW